jgi:hypothetical protein
VTRYLTGLIDQADGPVPLIDQLTADQLGTPAGTAAIARAALAGLRAKSPEVIRADLRRELLELDWLVRYRAREAGLDVHGRGSTDWPRIHQVATARAEYRQRWGVAC